MRRFYDRFAEERGISYSAYLRRLRMGLDPFNLPACVECGDPVERATDADDPRHKRCKAGYIPDYEVKRLTVIERDGGICQLCFEPVELGRSVSDWSPSLDHVVPRSHGGSHELENLRLAHRWCNSVRGAARVPDSFFA